MTKNREAILAKLDELTPQELKRYLAYELTEKRLGLHWESDLIERDQALNADLVFPVVDAEASHWPDEAASNNLIIEGDNFDSLRLLRSTHRGRIRVITIDPPYNTGQKDWTYNDSYVNKDDRWRHSKWLEFLYQRLELAKDLLAPDGVILVCINDENRAKLELLIDEVFPGRRIGSFVWRTKDTGNDAGTRFSQVHEHVLVYGSAGFGFNGKAVSQDKYRNRDNDNRGIWAPQPLSSNKTHSERPNTYYPIQDPKTGYWYPCDPDNVWRYASEQRIRERLSDEESVERALSALRSPTIEDLIAQDLIYFPSCGADEVMLFKSEAELLNAIVQGQGPVSPKKKTPLLRRDLPDLAFWVGKPIATGRPSRKDHWSSKDEAERIAPVSSWIPGINENLEAEDPEILSVLRSPRGGAATKEIKTLLGSKAFNYPKPKNLMVSLLQQATRPGDIVLDFFAGSGTTGHAVMELNAADGGNRQFILCSSTEATHKEPDKNLCRDICAERMRRVMAGYGDTEGLGGSFTYLTMDKVEEADLMFEGTAGHAFALLCLRETGYLTEPPADQPIWVVAQSGSSAIVVCPTTDQAAQDALKALPHDHLVLYSARPDSLAEALENHKAVTSYAIQDALRFAQAGDQATRPAVHEATDDAITTTTEGV